MADLYQITGPVFRLFSPETAHGLAIKALKLGLVPAPKLKIDLSLQVSLWGLDFPNPVGLAAGFDKNAEVGDAMLAQGFGFVEIGSVTPLAQPGNPKPRLFRLSEDGAVINRMGFNNEGLEAVAMRLAARPRRGILGANLGKNKTQEDAAADYCAGARRLAPLADYLVVNVSSPNTPGLRALQSKQALSDLLHAVLAVRDEVSQGRKVPLLLKIAPDLVDADKEDIAAVVLETKTDGLIVTNTTIERPKSLQSPYRGETGGLSGAPLFEPSTKVLREIYQLTGGKVPLVGVGGIASAEQAYAKIRAGASLVQLYSALVYGGPGLVRQINQGLSALLARDGFKNIAEAVGADHR